MLGLIRTVLDRIWPRLETFAVDDAITLIIVDFFEFNHKKTLRRKLDFRSFGIFLLFKLD